MSLSIHCRELGMDCPFEAKGETKAVILDVVMRHIRMDHNEKVEDWFEIEELYHAVCKAIYKQAV